MIHKHPLDDDTQFCKDMIVLILQANSLIAALVLELLQFPPAVEIGEEEVTVPLSSELPMEVAVALFPNYRWPWQWLCLPNYCCCFAYDFFVHLFS